MVLAGQEAGSGEIDVIDSVHGIFPPLAREDALMNMIGVAENLPEDREFSETYHETRLLGTEDNLVLRSLDAPRAAGRAGYGVGI